MKKVITAIDISAARKAGQASVAVPSGALVTPQALDDAREYGITLVRDGAPQAAPPVRGVSSPRVQPLAGNQPSANPAQTAQTSVAEEVRRQVLARLGNAAPPALDSVINSVLASGGQGSLRGGAVAMASSATLPASGNVASAPASVRMVEAVPPGAATPGIGYMSWEHSSFSWTFPHAEALVVLEGEVAVTAEGITLTGVAGDSFAIPAGVSVTFSAKGKALCVHSSWPNQKQ